MANQRYMGPVCNVRLEMPVEDGTNARWPGTRPGVVGGAAGVADWPLERKLLAAARRATPLLPADMQAQFAQLFEPANLAITGGILVAWAGSHAFGVGEIVDVVLLILGALTLGAAAWECARDLKRFFELAAGATAPAELDAAAQHLA